MIPLYPYNGYVCTVSSLCKMPLPIDANGDSGRLSPWLLKKKPRNLNQNCTFHAQMLSSIIAEKMIDRFSTCPDHCKLCLYA